MWGDYLRITFTILPYGVQVVLSGLISVDGLRGNVRLTALALHRITGFAAPPMAVPSRNEILVEISIPRIRA